MSSADPKYHYLYDDFAAEAHRVIHGHVSKVVAETWGEQTKKPLTVIRWGEKAAIASACGVVYPGWLGVDLLWVEPEYRGQGVGGQLLEKIEQDAVRLGAHSAYVWTQEYEAPGFYQKYGYCEFVRFQEFRPGHQLIGMQKKLVASPL